MDASRFGVDSRTNTVLRVVTDVPLLKSMAACRCGSRYVDVAIFQEHPNRKAVCNACGVARPGYVKHDILDEGSPGRPSIVDLSPARRFEILKRDGFHCVHCGHAAPRSGPFSERLDEVFVRELGVDWETLRGRDAAEHAKSCMACGQLLPGLYQTIPYADFARLTAAAKSEIDDILESGRLTIDHIIPVRYLEIDGVVREGSETKLVTRKLPVTSCYACNWGRGGVVEPLDDILELLRRTVFRTNPRSLDAVKGDLAEVHHRASLHARRLRSAG